MLKRLLLSTLLVLGLVTPASATTWSIGYYTPYGACFQTGCYPIVADIEWGGVTHIAVVGGDTQSDGSLTLPSGFAAASTQVIAAAHAHNVSVLYVVGGNMTTAINSHLSTLTTNIMSTVNTYGFDGVDVDYEAGYNATSIASLLPALRTALGTKLLTSAAFVHVAADYVSLYSYVDRVNLLSYGLSDSGAWFNAALLGATPPGWTTVSVDLAVTRWLAAGIPAAKIGIGIPFYGDLATGNGITGPRQGAGTSVTEVGYNDLVATYGAGGSTFDSQARVPWKAAGGGWLNWDNETSINEKVQYVFSHSLGGWILWHIGWDYIPSATPKHPLLHAIALNLTTTNTTRYVSTTGSDSNSCAASATITTPKRTFASALSCMAVGDTLLVRAGTYSEGIKTWPVSGTSWSNKVRIAAYPSGCATTCESVTLKPTTSTSDGWVLHFGTSGASPAYIEVDGINLDGTLLTDKVVYLDISSGGFPNHLRLQYLDVHAAEFNASYGGAITGGGDYHEFLHLSVHGFSSTGFYITGNYVLIDYANIYNTSIVIAGGQFYHSSAPYPHDDIIRNSIIHDVNSAAYFLGSPDPDHRAISWYLGGTGNHQFYNNIIYNVNSPGNTGPAILAFTGSNSLIYNNTIYNNTSHTSCVGLYTATGTIARNNICYANGGNSIDGGITADHNLLGTNPLFVSAGTHDFHLQAGSPARNTGITVSQVTTDFDAVARPQESAYDIGAYEFLASALPVPITVAITAPVASNASYETSTTPLTSLAGTASGGTVTGCTWTNTNGGSGSGSATGTTSWSVASISLTANAINHLTVTCSNNSPASSSASIDVYYVAAAGAASDTFTRANWPTLGPNWTTQTTGVYATVSNNQAVATSSVEEDEYFSGFTSSNDQCTQATIKSLGTGKYVGVKVRAGGADATRSEYGAYTDGSAASLYKVITGTATSLGTVSTTFVANDVMKLCVTGQSVQLYKNGTAAGSPVTVTTTTLSSGRMGILLQGAGAALDDISASSSTDVTPPTISITAPSSSGSYTATATPLTTLAGTAADNIAVSSVTWVNSAGGSGTATGTTSWSVASITLTAGTNNITVTAHDAAGNTTPSVISVTYVPPTPVTPPIVTITSFSTNYEVGSATLTSLAGTAFSSGGTITTCSWANTVGGSGSGIATGTTSWSVPSITLTANSINRLIVTCTDNVAQTGSAQVDVLYVPPVSNAADNFTRTNWPTLGPNWTTQGSYAMRVLSNAAYGQTASVDHYAAFTGWGLNANQCSQATITALTSGKVGVLVRASGNNAYLLTTDGSSGSGHTYIAKVLSGTQTSLGAISTTFSNGNTMKLCVTNSSLQAYKNGTAVGGAVTDSALTSGSAGVYTYNTTAAVDSFVGSNASGTTVNNKNPIADPGGPYTGTANTAVKVDASHSIAKRGVIKRYTWSWGDGTADSAVTTPITTHTFTAAGTYTVTLIVRDSRNKDSLPVSTTVTVS